MDRLGVIDTMEDAYTSRGWRGGSNHIKYEVEVDWVTDDYYLKIARYLVHNKEISTDDIKQVISAMEQMIQDIRSGKIKRDV